MEALTGNTTSRRTVAVVVTLCGVQLVDVLGVTVVTTALPRMLADLDATASQGAAVVNAYALFFGGLLMLAARVGDRVGHRRLLLSALALFACASVVGAVAPTVWVLAGSRALQGFAAAASVPSALRLLTTVVPEGAPRKRAVACWSAAGAAGGAAGFLVGGFLTEAVSWRAVFWLYVGLALLLAGAVHTLVDADAATRSDRIGWPSAALLTASAMGLVSGAVVLGDQGVGVLGVFVTVSGLVCGLAFAAVERRTPHPLVAPAARRSPLVRWGAFGSFLNTATTSASMTVATLYLQDELGLSAMATGTLLVTLSILVVVGSASAPRVLAGLGWTPTLAGGLATIAVGTLVLVVWPTVPGVGLAAGLSGLGIGLGSVAATDMGTSVEESLRATAAGVINAAAQLGTAVGTAVTLLVATALDARAGWALVTAYAAAAALTVAVRGRRQVAGWSDERACDA